MDLTIAELARAVNKSETYVRQHVNRKHLVVRKERRSVLVSVDEAVRWARARGLVFVSPVHAPLTARKMEGRTARITVLAWRGPDAHYRNLFTLLRHRRHDALGPWAKEPSEKWCKVDLGDELQLFSFEGSLEHCQELVNHILNSRMLEICDLKIKVEYALESVPRCHMAYRRNECQLADASVPSPFRKHSAEIIEYWSFAEQPHKGWLEVLESLQGKAPAQLAGLGFALDRRPDRVGNLMVAGAEDAITCDLFAYRDRTLRFRVNGDKFLPGAYRATIWASHSGDEVVRQEILANPGEAVIGLASEVDHIGFAVYRTSDGRYVDLMEELLTMEVNTRIALSGPTVQLRKRRSQSVHQISPFDIGSTISVELDQDHAELDKGIRRQWLGRLVYERETAARREGNFVRFGPQDFDEAVQHFLQFLQYSDEEGPIYLADRYFMESFPEAKKEQLEKLYLDIFAATTDRPLRILCTKCTEKDCKPSPWWSTCPDYLTGHVKVRTFLERANKRPGFHDRYLVTPEHEVLITHSLNGWPTDGVTFVRLPYNIYRVEAERLWSLDIKSTVSPLCVREIC